MTHAPNIFNVIRSVSSRVEPYHSAFLAAMLRSSLASDRRLFDAFWRMATPGWQLPGGDVTIHPEDLVVTGRVDLTLLEGESRVLGVEVKTRETSTTAGQLARYREGLEAKYAEQDLAIAYLTPFNAQQAGDRASDLPSVREFRRFAETFPRSRHLSWLDLADVDWDGGELWEQHRDYVRSQIASPRQRAKWSGGGRLRGLSHFFGPNAADEFDDRLDAAVGDLDGYALDLARVQDPAAFASTFRVLIESDAARGARGGRDTFDDASRERFLTAAAASVHQAIFALAVEYPSVWIEGTVDYGLRVAHPEHRSGVSLVTSRGVDRVEVGRPR